ncbi:alpha/beta fold hydrolase [Gymnodinialimonas sp. 2305UL16-5]|uniref:alpha/beta fold hydrolase n=1 Tax=Gymnodinialimonas mytili TaxID=3126503 RepID=UPI0030AC9ECF
MLHLTELGNENGAPVLFLHAGSYSGTMWRDIAARLPDLCCILPDLPGHGYSREIKLTTLEEAADAVAALIIDRYPGGPVHLVGLSFGAYVGLILMARHPQLIQRAMLSGLHLGALPQRRLMTLFAAVISPLIRLHVVRRKLAEPLGITDRSIYDRADGAANLTPRTLRSVFRLVSVFDVYDLLPTIPVPTLVIAGEREHSTITYSLNDFQRLMPNCAARIVPGLGHAWCREDPDLFAETVAAWQRGAPPPSDLAPIDA